MVWPSATKDFYSLPVGASALARDDDQHDTTDIVFEEMSVTAGYVEQGPQDVSAAVAAIRSLFRQLCYARFLRYVNWAYGRRRDFRSCGAVVLFPARYFYPMDLCNPVGACVF